MQIYMAADEVRCNVRILDSSYTQITHLYNTVFLSVYIWTQKIKQLGVVDVILDDLQVSYLIYFI